MLNYANLFPQRFLLFTHPMFHKVAVIQLCQAGNFSLISFFGLVNFLSSTRFSPKFIDIPSVESLLSSNNL